MMRRFVVVGALGLVAALAMPLTGSAESPDDILVIANNSVPVDSIRVGDVRDIFLKKRVFWKGGEKVVPVNMRGDGALRDRFRQAVLGMSAAEEAAYWAKVKIQRGTSEPAEIGNTLKAVYKLKGGISYVRRSEFKPGVAKVLLVL